MVQITHERISLGASDGFSPSAYHARPVERPRAGLVVVQEIFGVNEHIRRVADGFAAQGYEVIAPALFDRVERDVELGYDGLSRKKGMTFPGQLGFEKPLLDLQAAVDRLAVSGKVGIVGYCWGGTLAFLGAAKLHGLSAAVGYYGSGIAKQLAERPRTPLMLHFGERDKSIPASDIAAIQAKNPSAEIFTYPAEHGFNCDARGAYSPEHAQLARERTLAFFARTLGTP